MSVTNPPGDPLGDTRDAKRRAPAEGATLRRSNRFSVVPERLIRDPSLSDRAVRLWMLLDRYADSPQVAYPHRAALADDLGCSVRVADRAMDELVKSGWVER